MFWHVTIATEGRVVVFDGARRLAGVRALVRSARRALLFALVDDHVHVVLKGERAEVSHRVGGVARGLRAAGAEPLQPARFKAVEGRSHLENLVQYVVRQPAHHGVGFDALDAGGCLADLLGARCLPGFDVAAIRGELPRADVSRLAMDAAELPFRQVRAATAEEVRAFGVEAAWKTARAAAALDAVTGRSVEALALRAAWREVAVLAGFGAEARAVAAVDERTWRRLAHRAAAPALVAAVRTRIGLRIALEPRRPVAAPGPVGRSDRPGGQNGQDGRPSRPI